VKLLKFAGAQPSESEKDFEDAFVKRLQNSVKEVKASREMGARYMTFQELLKDERIEERCQVIIELLEELGYVSEKLQTIIRQQKDLDVLKKWCKLAAKCNTIDEFINRMENLD
jgi:hypothetical protein